MSNANQSIREITSKQPSAVKVLQYFGIDACAEAEKPLRLVCNDLQLSEEQLVEKLTELERAESGQTEFDPSNLTLTQIIQHIVRTHHQRVRWGLPELVRMAEALNEKPGNGVPHEIQQLVELLHKDLLAHIQKEEAVLFPFIAQMEEAADLAYPPAHMCFKTLSHPVFMMVQEHESATRIVAELRRRTNNFEMPEHACPTHVALLDGLRDFEDNLKQHIRLENDVLFPRAMQLESDLKGRK